MTAHQIDKSKLLIFEHKNRILKYMSRFINNIIDRMSTHDNSKLDPLEFEIYTMVMDEFKNNPFGSDGYETVRQKLGPAIEHHYANNRHHPEHFENGINGMDLVDLIEMIVDWKAASENSTGGGGNMMLSIDTLSKKYGMTPQLTQIMINTAKNFGLL